MKKKHKTRIDRVKEIIDFAENLVGKECIVKEDSILASRNNSEIRLRGCNS